VKSNPGTSTQKNHLLTFIEIPQYELLSQDYNGDFKLPQWLSKHEDSWKGAMRDGNVIANIIFGVLERELQLPSGTITSLHRMTDPSGDFLRVLRYPKFVPGKSLDRPGFPPHRDLVSLAILFTWLGGLQILEPSAAMLNNVTESEDSWRWVKPVPGCAIVNLGDAMQVLTNNVLKSGKHRVVKAPGPQAGFDRYSVLLGVRPAHTAIMRAFKSPMVPAYTLEQEAEAALTSREWGARGVGKLLAVMETK
jgi:isopenicillin N synthase-like dioxygenase